MNLKFLIIFFINKIFLFLSFLFCLLLFVISFNFSLFSLFFANFTFSIPSISQIFKRIFIRFSLFDLFNVFVNEIFRKFNWTEMHFFEKCRKFALKIAKSINQSIIRFSHRKNLQPLTKLNEISR